MVKRLRRHDDARRRWPEYLFGGHIRTSTFVLIVAFAAVWFVYNDHQQSLKSTPKTTQVPATQIVPPGFVPDPNYTWVPRTRVQEPTPTRDRDADNYAAATADNHDGAAAFPTADDCLAPAVRSARHHHRAAARPVAHTRTGASAPPLPIPGLP